MCCPGCAAVAELIAESGLDHFYHYRTSLNQRPQVTGSHVEEIAPLYDDPELNADFVGACDPDSSLYPVSSARLLLRDVKCAACTWLIESMLARSPGVRTANVSLASQSLTLEFEPKIVKLSELVNHIEALGYPVRPFRSATLAAQIDEQKKRSLRRLGVAGIGMMQVGMMAVALYVGEARGINSDYRDLLRLVSGLFATVVVFYSAAGFFSTAWRHLSRGALVMDLPVALAIGLAYVASIWATVSGTGTVYFDSVVMFTFLLLLGRFLEESSRQSLTLSANSVEDSVPDLCLRHGSQGWESVARQTLKIGDEVLVPTGSIIPIDGQVLKGVGNVSQASLDGEQLPRRIAAGDYVFAGTTNLDGSLEVRVAVDPRKTRLAAIQNAIEHAGSNKPAITLLADRVARHFVAFILLVTTATALFYSSYAPEKTLWICLSLLVVSCPCALALATPAALTATTHKLLQHGIIIRSPNSLESLAGIDHILFDKTGTLTEGRFHLSEIRLLGAIDDSAALQVAAGLQAHSNHPVACAFRCHPGADIKDCRQIIGAGMQGYLDDQEWRMGSIPFCRELSSTMPDPPQLPLYWLGLSNTSGAQALLGFSDRTRTEAPGIIQALKQRGIVTGLLTGDSSKHGARLTAELDLDSCRSACTPEDKLNLVNTMQREGAHVAMVGDGLNDAPVLQGAAVSFAMAGAADLTSAKADLVMSEDSLAPVLQCIDAARSCRRVIKQNLAWALGYNVTAIPLAAAGMIPPWAAAIGMSLSSLVVVTNSLRAGGGNNG